MDTKTKSHRLRWIFGIIVAILVVAVLSSHRVAVAYNKAQVRLTLRMLNHGQIQRDEQGKSRWTPPPGVINGTAYWLLRKPSLLRMERRFAYYENRLKELKFLETRRFVMSHSVADSLQFNRLRVESGPLCGSGYTTYLVAAGTNIVVTAPGADMPRWADFLTRFDKHIY